MEDIKRNIETALKRIEHPEITRTLFDLGMVKNIDIQEGKVALTLKVPMLDIPIKDYLIKDIESAVKREDENVRVEIDIEEMDKDERERFTKIAQEDWRG